MKKSHIRLGVNIDHIAFIKKARETNYPNLCRAVEICEDAGADVITIHLREDRRHIQDKDAYQIRQCCKELNFEMANTLEMVKIAKDLAPNYCCIVPEKREEKTTEGGLNLSDLPTSSKTIFKDNISLLKDTGIEVSLFINPTRNDIEISKELGAQAVELHTGSFSDTTDENQLKIEFDKLSDSSIYAHDMGLKVNAGHGLNYMNIGKIAKLPYINELNIGHSIVAESVFCGLKDAIIKIKRIIESCD